MKTTTKNFYALIGLVILLPGAVLTQSAHAANAVYPGSNCERLSGPEYRQNWGSIYNPSSTATLRVTCPFASNGYIDEAHVVVTDRNAESRQNVICEVVVAQRDSTTGAAVLGRSTRKSSQGFSSATTDLDFFQSDLARQSAGGIFKSAKFLLCSIPPRASTGVSYIHNYSVFD